MTKREITFIGISAVVIACAVQLVSEIRTNARLEEEIKVLRAKDAAVSRLRGENQMFQERLKESDTALLAVRGDLVKLEKQLQAVRPRTVVATAVEPRPVPTIDYLLQSELMAIVEDDRRVRTQLDAVEKSRGLNSTAIRALWTAIEQKDRANLEKIEHILDTRGWVGWDTVGYAASSAFFVVIQHADIAVEKKYLPLMEEAVRNGKASGSELALLEDSVAMREGRRQIYGSQIQQDKDGTYFVFPLDDPDNVDRRRALLGLVPIASYLQRWHVSWNLEAYKKALPELEAQVGIKPAA